MDAHQRCFAAVRGASRAAVQHAVLNGDGFFPWFASFNAENSEVAEPRGQLRFCDHASFAGVPGFFSSLHGIADYSRLAGIGRLRATTRRGESDW